MKDTWKDYFAFNKRQRNGILVLVSLIALLIIFLFISDYSPSSGTSADFSSFKNELEKAGIKSDTSKNKITSLIDINTADTTELMTLPKMTSYCASMIVRYRKKLGGYYTTAQLKEVWGMDSSIYNAVIDKVWSDSRYVHRLNINTADIKQLGYHPYIKYYLAKAIVNYREQHGPYAGLMDLHQMAAFDSATLTKIMPYLTMGDN